LYLKGNFQDEIVEHYLPSNKVTIPKKDGIEITFAHLLTHTSGLPRSPCMEGSPYPLPPGYDIENPYAAYTTEQVYDYLTNYCTLDFTPGTWWEYSNTGVGLVGHILGLIDGTSYETVLTRDIFNVLDMNNSSLFLTDQQKTDMALGHDRNKKMVPFFTANDIFQGAGMIKSSLNDMFKYLEANMGLVDTPLRNAMDLTHQRQMHQGSMGDQGLAWFILDLDDGQQIIYTGGDTNGHSTYMAFNKTESTGAIILLNCSMHDNTNLTMGPEIMKAIMKY
jgi:CubicO group peptidase (beta-lactamase class C family)